MTERMLNGDQAMALGALDSGVKLVTSYPGSPSSGTVEALIELAKKHRLYVEWSSNEKVAVEMGIGASIAGRRSLVCVKSVGMNAMIDPLMALNLTPLNGGMVILLGDDPGAYGSQNDQDTRPLVLLLQMPLLEPASPAEGYAMMREAFTVSEKYGTAVIIRETRSFSQASESVSLADEDAREPTQLGLKREAFRFVPVPENAVEKHRALLDTMEKLGAWAEDTSFNRAMGGGDKGIITAGFAHNKFLDVLGVEIPDDLRLLRLGNLYPLPVNVIAEFLQECSEVLVIEENGPFIERQIKALAHDLRCQIPILGKESKHVHREGELFRWQIQRALHAFLPAFVPERVYQEEQEAEERPKTKKPCAGCRYDEIIDRLEEAAEKLGQKPVLVGDPGCLVTVADRLDAKYAIGSAVGVADGLSKAGCGERAIAIFGDSAFFHTTLPAVCNVVHNRSDILMVVLDNKATAASGFQPHPGVGKDALGAAAPALDIVRIARACGVEHIYDTHLDDDDTSLVDIFRTALGRRELALVIVRFD